MVASLDIGKHVALTNVWVVGSARGTHLAVSDTSKAMDEMGAVKGISIQAIRQILTEVVESFWNRRAGAQWGWLESGLAGIVQVLLATRWHLSRGVAA